MSKPESRRVLEQVEDGHLEARQVMFQARHTSCGVGGRKWGLDRGRAFEVEVAAPAKKCFLDETEQGQSRAPMVTG